MLNSVEAIHGVWHWVRRPHFRSRSNSPPGHTIHYMERGDYELTLNGKTRQVHAGDMVFYGSVEDHSWKGLDSETAFYSINYQPRELASPGDEHRIFATDGTPGPWFASAYAAFKEASDPVQQALCFAAVYRILAYSRSLGVRPSCAAESTLWRNLEKTILQRRLFRVPIHELARMSGYNSSTVYRSCQAAHGVSPLVRLRDIRLEEARNLLVHSNLPIHAVAAELGFPRMHEFSREFARFEASTPLEYRKKGATQ